MDKHSDIFKIWGCWIKLRNRGRPKKRNGTKQEAFGQKTISISEFKRRICGSSKQHSKNQGREYSIAKCLEVLRAKDDASGEILI